MCKLDLRQALESGRDLFHGYVVEYDFQLRGPGALP
jgi:hypothetical protein